MYIADIQYVDKNVEKKIAKQENYFFFVKKLRKLHPKYGSGMQKEKYYIEYVFRNSSFTVLWNRISTPAGLADWFADKVEVYGRQYVFTWGDITQQAELVLFSNGSFIRFRWEGEEYERTYFELKLSIDELSTGVALIITDFAEPAEKKDAILLWDKQVENLKRISGL